MPIVNPDKIYYLYSDDIKDELIQVHTSKMVQGYGGISLRFRNFSELPVYYLEFNSAKSLNKFKLNSFINFEILNKIINKDIFLVLNNSYESFHDVVDSIYTNIVIEQHIPESQIILCSESSDIFDKILSVSKIYNKELIKAEWLRQGEYNIQKCSKLIGNQNVNILQSKEYYKKFLCLNRRWRPHRVTLVALLKDFNLIDKGFVSLGEADDNKNWSNIWDEIIELSKHHAIIKNSLDKNKQSLINSPSLYVDTTDLKTNRVVLEPKLIKYYKDSYFSVVTETNFYTGTAPHLNNQSGRFLSEKIFKPILCGHPFIVVSVPNFLEKLKEIGYKTFSPYINEFYDTVLDDNERLYCILLEIERLCNLNQDQLTYFLNGVKEITKHNQSVLIRKKIFHNKFYE